MERSTRFGLVEERMRIRGHYENAPGHFRREPLADVRRLEHSDAD